MLLLLPSSGDGRSGGGHDEGSCARAGGSDLGLLEVGIVALSGCPTVSGVVMGGRTEIGMLRVMMRLLLRL